MSTTRRKFSFYLGLGLFTASETFGVSSLDRLAAAAMRNTGEIGDEDSGLPPKPVSSADASAEPSSGPGETDSSGDSTAKTPADDGIHWSRDENSAWTWFVREHWRDEKWQVTGITRPRAKENDEFYSEGEGYLEESVVPKDVLNGLPWRDASPDSFQADGDEVGQPSAERRARHGRPPSEWLRSLSASELRRWLKKVSVPEAGVSGMTFWTHLTRDHSFLPEVVDRLTKDEQAKLHSAAHYGY